MRMTVSRWHRTRKVEALCAVVRPRTLLPAGSVGVKVGLVAEGAADLYLHPSRKTAEWDTCAPAAVLLGAGGTLTDLFGAPLRYNQPDPMHPRGLVATNPDALPVVLERIAGVAATFGFG
jgi:3'(2'), 5'-bisphosphate nucleotidase